MTERAPSRSTLILCLVTVWVVWGSSYLATRIGVSHLPPLLFGGLRFLTSGVLLLAFSRWRGTFDPAVLRTDWRRLQPLTQDRPETLGLRMLIRTRHDLVTARVAAHSARQPRS